MSKVPEHLLYVFTTPICKMTYEQCEIALDRVTNFAKQWGWNSVEEDGQPPIEDAQRILERMAELRPVIV